MKPGDVVAARYRLERPLGAGGMGAVWEATHLLTHRHLALKVLHDDHDDPAARRRVLREARAACAVKHPNVVTVHDVIERDDGAPVLVMDLLEGESLATRLEREKTLAPNEAMRIARAVLSALEAAHAVGIVHRDLKPDNVFLCDGNVRILDFGVAKLEGRDPTTKETKLTETGAMVGTPHYMAPEQAFGEEDVDARADLWAIGAVLYECLCGVPPTDGQNLGQILKALATGKIITLAERAPQVPPALAAIVDALLRVERKERPASATAVIALLDAVGDLSASPPAPAVATSGPTVREASVTPRPATRDALPASSVRPRRTWLYGALGFVGFVLFAAVIGVVFVKRAPAPPPEPVVAAPPPALPTPTPTETASTTATLPAPSASASTSSRPPLPKTIHAKPTSPRTTATASASAGPASPLLDKPTF